MRKTPPILALVTASVFATSGSAWAAPPSVAEMLAIKPKFDDVAVATPAADEAKACTVDDVTVDGKTIGYSLLDSRKQVLRRFVMSKGARNMNVWCFFKDGVEVFRQIDSNFNNKVDQYRWLGTGGLKWGVDRDEDGKIDNWFTISAEEVAQEAFQALSTGDFARLKALYITPAEIQELGMNAAAGAKMLQAQQGSLAKFQQALGKQPSLAKANFVRVENASPGCYLAESLGTPKDVIKHASMSIMYETAKKEHDWVQIGEVVQVGLAWRLVDLTADADAAGTAAAGATNPELNKHLSELSDVDKNIGDLASPEPGKPHAVLAGLYEKRAALAEKIVGITTDAKEKETWYKQILDSLSSGAIAGSDTAKERLDRYAKQLVSSMPGTNLAAYAVYRQMWAQYAPELAKGNAKAQEAYNEQLAKFVKDYPRADDTPDSLHQLGMNCEFTGTKEKEDEAARWYQAIHNNFPTHHLAEWARGAERRLKLTGNPLQLAGRLVDGNAFDVNQLKGKTVVVYYWASHCKECVADFARLRQAVSTQKDVEVVCVNLDSQAASGSSHIQQNQYARHVIQAAGDANGLRGALATQYGINVLPTVFLVGRDGRVINSKLQVADVEEALKKATQQ